ncbi:MAG: glutamate-5-semialdehyde dehydrogenase [Caulobacterales bacterium]
MNTPGLRPHQEDKVLHDDLLAVGAKARVAAHALRTASGASRTAGLSFMADAIAADADAILAANAQDVEEARRNGQPDSFLDRLALNPARLSAVVAGVREAAALPDPLGTVIADWTRPNGLRIQRVRTPLGVIGLIFESRPNVAADAGALCVRSGNAAILRGGSESVRSVGALVGACRAGLARAGLPEDAIQAVASRDRAAVGMMLAGLEGAIDVIVPRGGKSLVARVQAEARVPVFAHLEGICHTYIHAGADPEKAVAISVNAKMRRVSVCGATETILIDRAVASSLLPKVARALTDKGCALVGDAEARAIVPMEIAREDDWSTEYSAARVSVRVVAGVAEAVAHIATYGSSHTEAIITEDPYAAETFLQEVDSAIVMVNASTQFADGGEFGFGGEIGIATGRMHARGPVGAEQLTIFKYVVRGTGQTRP